MKKTLLKLFFCMCIFFPLLLFPDITIEGAKEGLSLWLFSIVPALLPFMILTNLILPLCESLPNRIKYYFPLFAGLLCGYPIGAKLSCEYYQKKIFTKSQANFFSCICNQPSPMFLIGYIKNTLLKHNPYAACGLALHYLGLLFSALILFYRYRTSFPGMQFSYQRISDSGKNSTFDKISVDDTNQIPEEDTYLTFSQFFFLLDNTIQNSIKIMLQLGGYILLFAILSKMILFAFSAYPIYGNLICAMLEITTGSAHIADIIKSDSVKMLIIFPFISFGGLCTAAQTNIFFSRTDIKIKPYILAKAIHMALTFFLCVVYLLFVI